MDGERLVIVDIGAHVGSFAIWASMRWPGSLIHCYEPHPKTFEILQRNATRYPGIECAHAAIFPGLGARSLLWSRYDGDGESGLVEYIGRTFTSLSGDRLVEVPIIAPSALKSCDVLKIDVEGAEAEILGDMDLRDVSLILLEYQDVSNREKIRRLLAADFILRHESRHEWRLLLDNPEYRRELEGDQFGQMFFVRRRQRKLRPVLRGPVPGQIMSTLIARTLSLSGLLRALPRVAARALKSRIKRKS